MPPGAQLSNPNLTIPTRFVHTSTNKVKCPVNVVKVSLLYSYRSFIN